MASEKTLVIEHLWLTLQAEGRRIATAEDVRRSIAYCVDAHGIRLKKDSNPFNFMKDLLRGSSVNANWPPSLTASRITAKQSMGDGSIMEFVPFPEGQDLPFVNPFEPGEDIEVEKLQSISIPLTTKTLGRNDESWLIQVAVNLKVVEHHLATKSPLGFQELTHLQVAVKLGNNSEVDSLFWGVVQKEDNQLSNVIVTCEAKTSKDPILEDQIVRQVRATFKSVASLGLKFIKVIPIAIKSIKGGSIYVVEFEGWTKEQAEDLTLEELRVASRGIYSLAPPVPGVGIKPPTNSARQRRGNA